MGYEHPDWLPAGWRVTVKARSTGKKDKYYVNTVNGRTFNSKPKVLRYLKSSRKDQKAKNPVQINVRKTIARELPPGWIKKIRTKKKHGKTRRDPTYIDPVSGRHFRSMQEVFRYLESKDSGNVKSKTDAAKSRHHPQPSPAEAKEQKPIDKKADENIIRYERVRSRVKTRMKAEGVAMKNVDTTGATRSEPIGEEVCLAIEFSDKLRKVKRRADKLREIKKLADNEVVVEVADKDQIQTPKSGAVNEDGQCTDGRRQSKRLADIKLNDSITTNRALRSASKGSVENSKRESSKRKWVGDLPRRTSSRLARSLATKTSSTTSIGKAGPSDETEIDTKGKVSKSNVSKELPAKCRMENPTDDWEKKGIILGEQKSVGFDATQEKQPGSTLENLLMDPCIEFAVKTLTGAIPIEDVTKVEQTQASSSTLPSSVGIWSDPCFEFAVKTLTGEAPSQVQITLPQPFGGYDSPTVPRFRSDNLYTLKQSSNEFDDVKKPCVGQ